MSEGNAVSGSPRYQKWIIAALISLTVFIYFYAINKYAVNIPMKDDYEAILNFLNKFSKADFFNRLSLLFSQHNEHRILSSRIVYAISYIITGGVNFKVLGIIANLQLVFISTTLLYVLWHLLPKYFPILSLMTVLCVFDFSNYENSIMAMEGMQNYGVVMLFLLALFFSSKNDRTYLIPTAIVTLLTIFSSGNGVIAAFFILIYNLLIANKIQKITLTFTTIAGVVFYYINYQHTSHDFGSYDVSAAVNYFVSMAGAHFAFGEITNTENANIFGCLIIFGVLVSFPYGKKMISDKYLLLLFMIMCFILSSMATISVFRSQTAGNPFYSSRYMIYSNLLMVVFILTVTYRFFTNSGLFRLSSAVFLLFCIYSYANNYNYGEKGFDLEHRRLINETYYFDKYDRAASIAVESCNLNIYCIDNHR